jgi:hypothetical protein
LRTNGSLAFPFVHVDTIGQGWKTVVEGPIDKGQDDQFQIWVSSRIDHGTLARRAEEMAALNKTAMLECISPNIWENRIRDGQHSPGNIQQI